VLTRLSRRSRGLRPPPRAHRRSAGRVAGRRPVGRGASANAHVICWHLPRGYSARLAQTQHTLNPPRQPPPRSLIVIRDRPSPRFRGRGMARAATVRARSTYHSCLTGKSPSHQNSCPALTRKYFTSVFQKFMALFSYPASSRGALRPIGTGPSPDGVHERNGSANLRTA
jgi:hypothetical protein